MSGAGITASSTCPCCQGRGTVAVDFTKPASVKVLADDQSAMQSLSESESRVSLAEHAKRAGMSRLSFHGTDRRKQMGLVETSGPGGIYLTPQSSARHVSAMREKRETRRLNKK